MTGVAIGAEVELISGLFAGKRGVIQAIQRGEAEVQVGAMSLKVPLAGLRAL